MERQEIIHYLRGSADEELFARSRAAKLSLVGDRVYLRGLIELSNICNKNCYYCGIRAANLGVARYELNTDQVMRSVDYAISHRYGSLVLQAGEQNSARFVDFVEDLLRRITIAGGGRLGVTLSLGEQSLGTYARWREAGAHRYLLRIESFSSELYAKIHPSTHSWSARMECLRTLQTLGYQLGTGVMVGLPYQTLEDLSDDLLGLVALDVDMCGMGPYVEAAEAPLARVQSGYSGSERVLLTLRMVSLLRIMMPDINIASTTALDALDLGSRVRCLSVGANVVMPNISPDSVRGSYSLYANKPIATLDLSGLDVAYGEQGNSPKSGTRDLLSRLKITVSP